LDSLYANTSIKFAGGVSDKDAYALARNMRCEPAFIAEQPKGSFAGYVRNTTKNAITLKFPFIRLDGLPRMNEDQYEMVRDAIRERYGVGRAAPRASEPAKDDGPTPASKETASAPAAQPTAPSPMSQEN